MLMMVSLYVLINAGRRHCTDRYASGLKICTSHSHILHFSQLIFPLFSSTQIGGRLCTGEEILDRCTAATGCSLNKALVWACTASNTSSCTEGAECCSGLCNASGVCEDVVDGPPDTLSPSTSPSTSPTKGPTNVVSLSIYLCVFHFSQLSRV